MFRKIIRSAFSLVTHQEGRVSARMLAFHATSVLGVPVCLIIFGSVLYLELVIPKVGVFWSGQGIEILVGIAAIWLVLFSIVRKEAESIDCDQIALLSRAPIIWTCIISFSYSVSSQVVYYFLRF